MKQRRAWWIVIVVLVIGAVGVGLFWRQRPLELTLASVHAGRAADLVYATGFVEAEQPVTVQSRITAPVSQVLVDEGARVTMGQPLVLLADEEQDALRAQAAAQRRAAEQTESRTVTLFREGWVTRAARDQAVSTADAARAAERTAAARQDQLVVRALIAGVVTKRDIQPGELATPTRVMLLLGDPARIRITATVDERDIARVRVGQAALMSSDAWPGRNIPATVAEITPTGDPNQRAFRVRLRPVAAADLPLGISLEVNIVSRADDHALLIPARALVDGHVWVLTDGRAQRRAVRTGIIGSDSVQVVDGLKAGETVIADPPADLAEGRRVTGKRG